MLTNKTRSVLYIGVTSNPLQRVWDHKTKKYKGSFSARYNVDRLVYFEVYESITEAIDREKVLKGWSRAKKELLINEFNSEWRDMFEDL